MFYNERFDLNRTLPYFKNTNSRNNQISHHPVFWYFKKLNYLPQMILKLNFQYK